MQIRPIEMLVIKKKQSIKNTLRVKYIFISVLLIWTLIVSFLFIFEMVETKNEINTLVKTEAQANFNKDQAIRNWVASHGGIYVPIDSLTPANKYLAHIKDRDIETKSGKKLTLMNPAYMIRQLNEYFKEYYGIVGHITSLKLLRPENKPDDWERNALEQFEKGITEVSEYGTINDKPYYRLMQPMKVTSNCLKCHAHQGYKINDIRGGVAVAIPVESYKKLELSKKKQLIIIYVSLWCIVTIILIISYINLKKQIKIKEAAEEKIKTQYIEIQQKNKQLEIFNKQLENQVKQRTKELSDSKEELITQNTLLIFEKEKAEASEKKLKIANDTKDKFFSIIAHDLRSPFSAIIGFSDILMKNHAQFDNQERGKMIKLVVDSAKETYKLLENLLDWSSTQTGTIEFSPKQYKIEKIFTDIILQNELNVKQKDINLSYQIDHDIFIFADKYMLFTVIRNLISNAIKFTNKKGKIELKAIQNNKNVIISVSDNGIGISNERQKTIFDTNVKTITSGTENERGSGLGLILCKEFVEKHNGEIWVESKENIGSTFSFTIPKKPE